MEPCNPQNKWGVSTMIWGFFGNDQGVVTANWMRKTWKMTVYSWFFHWKCQLIGLREKLQGNPICHRKIYGFRLRFSLKSTPWKWWLTVCKLEHGHRKFVDLSIETFDFPVRNVKPNLMATILTLDIEKPSICKSCSFRKISMYQYVTSKFSRLPK